MISEDRRTEENDLSDVTHNKYFDKLIRCTFFHSYCQILSASKTGFIVSAHKQIDVTLLTLVQPTL